MGQIHRKSETIVIVDSSDKELTISDNSAISSSSGVLMAGRDGASARFLSVSSDGRLAVTAIAPVPSGSTNVSQGYTGNVGGVNNQFYTIPVGEQLQISRFAGGGEFKSEGSKCELYYAPNGSLAGIQLIRVGYVNGSNFEFTLNWSAPDVGDGTRAILVRRERLSGGSREIAAFWDGYY